MAAFLIKRTLTKTLSHNNRHSFHHSPVLSHHLPREPNTPYDPPWKPLPLFPPGASKKLFEKIKEKNTTVIDYITKGWAYFERTMKVVGPIVGTLGAMVYFKNKELEKERKVQNQESKKNLEDAIQEFRASTAAAVEQEMKIQNTELKKSLEDAIQEFRASTAASTAAENKRTEKKERTGAI